MLFVVTKRWRVAKESFDVTERAGGINETRMVGFKDEVLHF
jgi:hypothetical protein